MGIYLVIEHMSGYNMEMFSVEEPEFAYYYMLRVDKSRCDDTQKAAFENTNYANMYKG